MKLLIDKCLSGKVAVELSAAGHDVDTVQAWGPDPGDPEILHRAAAAGRVLVTIDRGFGQLSVRERLFNAGIIVIRKTPATEHAAAVLRAIEEHREELLAGGIVIVMPERMRARWPDEDA